MAEMNWLQQMLYDLNRVPDDALPPGAESIIIGPKGDQGYFRPGPPISSDYLPMAAESAAQAMPVPGVQIAPSVVDNAPAAFDFARGMGDQITSSFRGGLDRLIGAIPSMDQVSQVATGISDGPPIAQSALGSLPIVGPIAKPLVDMFRSVSSEPSPREVELATRMNELTAQNMAAKQRKADEAHNAKILSTVQQMLSLAKGTAPEDVFVARGDSAPIRGDGRIVEGASFSKSAAGTSARQSKNLGFGDEFAAMLTQMGMPAPLTQTLSEARKKNPEVAAQIIASMISKKNSGSSLKDYATILKALGGLNPDLAGMIMSILQPDMAAEGDMLSQVSAQTDPKARRDKFNELRGRK